MKSILIANLGNRNLLVNGKLIDKANADYISGLLLSKKTLNFREITHRIYAKIEEYQKQIKLQPNIINTFLNNQNNIERVLLIGSDQVNEKKQDQDTIWEAEILSHIIEKKYKIPCDVIRYERNVTNNNDLLKFYARQLHQWQEKFAEFKFIICDAGGTAQQKSSLKIAAEFILGKDDFEVYYKPIDNDTLVLVDQFEYRKIIVSEQINSLIESGNYSGALSLCKSLDKWELYNDLNLLLRFGKYRISNLFKEIDSKDKKNKETFTVIKVPQFINDYRNRTPQCSEKYKQLFGEKLIASPASQHAFHTSELYFIANFYLKISNLTSYILALAIFIESFTLFYISSHTGFNLVEKYRKDGDELLKRLKNEYKAAIEAIFPSEIKSLSLPLQLAFSKLIAVELNDAYATQFIELLMKMNGSYKDLCITAIDNIRNNIAHKGKGVKESQLKNFFNSGIPSELDQFIGISEPHPYLLLNSTIASLLKGSYHND